MGSINKRYMTETEKKKDGTPYFELVLRAAILSNNIL